MKNVIFILCLFFRWQFAFAQNAMLENSKYCFVFNTNIGNYSIIDKELHEVCLENAYFQLNQWKSTDSIFTHEVRLESKQTLHIISKSKVLNIPELHLKVKLEKGNFFSFQCGTKNTTGHFFRLQQISPVTEGYIYPQQRKSNDLNLLDGFGGGEPNQVCKQLPAYSRNNLLLHWEENNTPYNIVAGGMTYTDFEKFVLIENVENRRTLLQQTHHVKAYLNLGFDHQDGFQERLRLGTGEPLRYNLADGIMHTGVYSWNFVLIEALCLNPNKDYYCGISWCDNGYTSLQSVYADNGRDALPKDFTNFKPLANYLTDIPVKCLLGPMRVPNINKGETPVQILFPLSKELYKDGMCRLLIKHNAGQKAIASEIFLCEGNLKAVSTTDYPIINPNDSKKMQLRLYAYDEVGKGIKSGEFYMPEDRFYFDLSEANPFVALEKYAATVKEQQKVTLNYYPFPTTCMWYAYERQYGNSGLDGTSSACLKEIKIAKAAGFCNYSPLGMRLVPVSLGWFDDIHALYGTYSKPCDTTRKWGDSIQANGGIPFYYFTNVRIPNEHNEYADTYPQHMLFNQSKAYIPCFDFMQNACSGFDYTDPSFIRHLTEYTYPRLKAAGVKGGMWDFPYTTWPKFGGMEDSCSTAAAAYVNIYRIAQDGLGKGALLQERNLDRGTDVTLGYISSQRTQGDTDLHTTAMATQVGLRWYKNRILFNYDTDAKNLLKAFPNNIDGRRKMLTMAYVTSSRFLLANSFQQLDKQQIYDLTRIFPFHQIPISARPLDMFIRVNPQVYDAVIHKGWHQLTLYNIDDQYSDTLIIALGNTNSKGGMELNMRKEYHIYDFWNDEYVGRYKGNDTLTQRLRPGEARMLSVREVTPYPQIISTNRHVMQGLVELSNVEWNKNILSGKILLIKNEIITLTIALNQWKIKDCPHAKNISVTSQIARIQFVSEHSGYKSFQITFNYMPNIPY